MENSRMLRDIIDGISSKYGHLLSDNDRLFLKRVCAVSGETYRKRLDAIGFLQRGKILDAGCGFGQWSVELARHNPSLCAIDMQPLRLKILAEIVEQLGLDNVETKKSRLEELPYDDNTFDGIFCYGVISCTDWKKTLGEFARVLKKDGILYLTANGLGWYLNLWKNRPHETTDYNPRENAALSFWNTTEYEATGKPPARAHIIIEVEEMTEAIKERGLTLLEQGGEGTICINKNSCRPEPFFSGTYFGEVGVYEIVATKKKAGEGR